MTGPVRPPALPPAASIWAIATGLLALALGFLAAVAQGMASAPTLRAAGRKCAIALLIGFVALYAVSQILLRAGIYDG